MSILFSLLVFVLVMCIVFWLLNVVLSGFPGVPPAVRGIVLAIVALMALFYLFGGHGPWLHTAVWR